jgi:hypothetical protein
MVWLLSSIVQQTRHRYLLNSKIFSICFLYSGWRIFSAGATTSIMHDLLVEFLKVGKKSTLEYN